MDLQGDFGLSRDSFGVLLTLLNQDRHHGWGAEIEVIAACAVLHNICLGVGDVVAPEDRPEDRPEGEEETVSAVQWRDRLSAELSALEEVQMDHEYL
uniref:DDE Tnp4 domain-containing protein n=1 Tax=Knipowitschia caucasica TaxID=637954 RepID=A0AAV2KMU8_KNICA